MKKSVWDDVEIPETEEGTEVENGRIFPTKLQSDSDWLLKAWNYGLSNLKGKNPDGLPEIENIEDLERIEIPEPDEIVKGVLHRGSKGVLGAPSKGRKTWIMLDLAISVATGSPWLGFPTTNGRVLYVNFELQKVFFRKRHRHIKQDKGIHGKIPNLDTLHLRGYAASASEIIPKIQEKALMHDYSLIILDPTYKMLGDKDENSTHVIASLLNEFEKLAVQTGAAVVFAAHFAKGNSSQKSAIDRISGSGVFARDPDSILIMTENDDQGAKDAFTLSFILRNFRPIDEFVIQWGKWTFARNDFLDPKKLKDNTKAKKCSEDQILAVLGEETLDWGVWDQRLCCGISGLRRWFLYFRLWSRADRRKRILKKAIKTLQSRFAMFKRLRPGQFPGLHAFSIGKHAPIWLIPAQNIIIEAIPFVSHPLRIQMRARCANCY